MSRGYYPYPDHKYLLKGELLPCPFCGDRPYIDSSNVLIEIGCERCGYHRAFNGLIQSDFKTDVVIGTRKDTGEPYAWYDKDAYEKARAGWNTRTKVKQA